MSNKKEVFCIDCKHSGWRSTCKHEGNIAEVKDYYESIKTYKVGSDKINKNNDCKCYEKEEVKKEKIYTYIIDYVDGTSETIKNIDSRDLTDTFLIFEFRDVFQAKRLINNNSIKSYYFSWEEIEVKE